MNERLKTYTDVVSALSQANVPVRELITGEGRVAVTTAAGRIVAMAFSPEGPNLLWSNPQLSNTDLVKTHPDQLVGGFGGDRLWFAPELDYHWDGPPQWDTLANYHVPPAADPGQYRFVAVGRDAIALQAEIQLSVHATGHRVGFEVERTLRPTPSPLPADDLHKNIEYVGIESCHTVRFDRATNVGRIDLWHLLQVPTGSVLIVPLKVSASLKDKTPLSYALPGEWIQKSGCILWRYGGNARAKFGLGACALTGRTGVLRELAPGHWCLIVREFHVDEKASYADHPYRVPRTDQVFQAWDGLGFGEMEYHSPMLDAQQGPRKIQEVDLLWAFGGSPAAIASLAKRVLGTEVTDILQRETTNRYLPDPTSSTAS